MDGGAGHCPEALGSCGAARLPGCSAAGFKEALAVGCVMCGLTGALLPDVRRRSGGRRTHHTSGPKESLLTACRVQSRMSMDSSALLSGTDLLRLGEGFSGSAGDSKPHRICAAARQAVSGGMLVIRAGAGSFCGRLLNGQGRRPCRRHRWNWLKAIIKGGGLPALLSLLWESGDAGTEIKRPPYGFTFPKEVEADT